MHKVKHIASGVCYLGTKEEIEKFRQRPYPRFQWNVPRNRGLSGENDTKERLAELLGYRVGLFIGNSLGGPVGEYRLIEPDGSYGCCTRYDYCSVHSGGAWGDIPDFYDLNEMVEVEEKLKEMGLIDEYAKGLTPLSDGMERCKRAVEVLEANTELGTGVAW